MCARTACSVFAANVRHRKESERSIQPPRSLHQKTVVNPISRRLRLKSYSGMELVCRVKV